MSRVVVLYNNGHRRSRYIIYVDIYKIYFIKSAVDPNKYCLTIEVVI